MTTEHDACDNRIFVRLGEKAALGADAVQWILYRGRDPNPDKPIPDKGLWQGKLWTAGSFIRSTKAALVRCIREKGLELSPEGRAAMDALADDFDSWRADPACAIGTDGLQWIVFKAVSRPSQWSWQDRQWDAVGYIHSSKRALLACIEAKGLELSPAGRAAIARQDAKICRWRRARPMEAAA
jgi:hypothetical protein